MVSAARHYLSVAPPGPNQCTNYVHYVFLRAGVEVEGAPRDMWERALELGTTHHRSRPSPGDIAFFDQTFDRNGKKYGIDPKMIRLGDFSIPTALLALLPMNNVQANPTGIERARRLSSMRTEIMEQADRRARDDDFYAAVRALRLRKEKERAEAAARQQGGQVVTPPGAP